MSRHALVLSALSLVVGCVAPTSSDGGGGRECTLIGCVNGAQMSIAVDASAEWLKGATFEVCRNGVCGHASPDRPPVSPANGAAFFGITGGLYGTLTVEVASPGFRVGLQVQIGDAAATIADGEHYVVTVSGADGAVAAKLDRAATYVDSWPNGKECDVDPCRNATLESGSIYVP